MIPTRSLVLFFGLFFPLTLIGCASPSASAPSQESSREPAPEPSAAFDTYREFRSWVNAQPEELRAKEQEKVLAVYSDHLAAQGLGPKEIETRRELLLEGAENQEVELWNRLLTAEEPRFNTDPNAFLVRMIEGREPGRALDVGMGQGRNAIWLAQEGWQVTGFDPADRAVARAHELAAESGVEITTEVVGSEEFDWGSERWNLIVLSYVRTRDSVDTILEALAPGGLVVLEAFHDDATKESSIGRGVVWYTNELLDCFSDFRVLHYEDTTDIADFGRNETPVVRLLAMKKRE